MNWPSIKNWSLGLSNPHMRAAYNHYYKMNSALGGRFSTNTLEMNPQHCSIFNQQLLELLKSEEIMHNVPIASTCNLQKWAQNFVAMTPYMKQKVEKFGCSCYYASNLKMFENQLKQKSAGLLIGFNSNLEPSILATVLYQNSETGPSSALQTLLTFLYKNCKRVPSVIFTSAPNIEFQQVIAKFNTEFQRHISLQQNFSYKFQQMKRSLISKNIAKRPYLRVEALSAIKLILEEKEERKCMKLLQNFFKENNQEGFEHFISAKRDYRFFSELPKQFYGFFCFKKYDDAIQMLLKKMEKLKFPNSYKFYAQIMRLQYIEMELKRNECVDAFNIFEANSRIKLLKDYIEPRPLSELIENYQKSVSIKFKKAGDGKYIIGGRISAPLQVTYDETSREWICQCGLSAKIGIPCEHVLKVCSLQQFEYDSQISKIYFVGQSKPLFHLD